MITLIWLLGLGLVYAQQFSDITFPYDLLNLTTACFTAVNTTLSSCPSLLGASSSGDGVVDLLGEDSLELLCVDACQTELESLRSAIESACTASTDVMVYDDIAYPATFMVDNFYYNYQISCYQDPTTNEYCDLVIADWQNNTNTSTSAYDCTDCMLGPMKLQVESPLWSDEEWIEDFTSLTSSCGATGYTYTLPTAYALNSSTSTTTTASITGSASATSAVSTATTSASTCVGSYIIQTNDTCNSIATAQNVSTYDFIVANNLNIFCLNLPDVGEEVCIPESCSTATLLSGDTCLKMMNNWNASLAQVLAWNPIFDSQCDNLYLFLGWQICTGPQGGWSIASTGGSTATVAAVPTSAMTTSNHDCAQWHTVVEGDDCATISDDAGISLADFLFLNPEVSANCTNLWLGYSYCVEAVGNIATYTGYTVTRATTSFTRPATTTTTWTPGPTYTLPAAAGTDDDCVMYKDYYSASSNGIAAWGLRTDILESLDLDLNNCSYYTDLYGVTLSEIVDWNPSLQADNCTFAPGYSYCIVKSWNDTSSSANTTSSECESVQSSWIVDGTASDCSCYVAIYGYYNTTLTCETIEDGVNNITESTLLALNPWIGTGNCTTGLFSGLNSDSARAVCIAAGNSSTSVTTSTGSSSSVPTPASNTATATITPSATSTTTSAAASVTMEPGYPSTCDKIHQVVSGDSCSGIASEYGITLAQFYDWNPDVGDSCADLWLGYGVCVGVSSSSATATSS